MVVKLSSKNRKNVPIWGAWPLKCTLVGMACAYFQKPPRQHLCGLQGRFNFKIID